MKRIIFPTLVAALSISAILLTLAFQLYLILPKVNSEDLGLLKEPGSRLLGAVTLSTETEEYMVVTFNEPNDEIQKSIYGIIFKNARERFPFVNHEGDLGFKGMIEFYSDDIYYEDGYIGFIRTWDEPGSEAEYQVWVFEIEKGDQVYYGDLLTIAFNEKFEGKFDFKDFLSLNTEDRCDLLYQGVSFDPYVKEDVEPLILAGCIDGTVPGHSVDFAGDKSIEPLPEDWDWIRRTIEECGETCRFLKTVVF